MKRWNLANKNVARAICIAMSIVMLMGTVGCGKSMEDVQATLATEIDENASKLESVLNAQVAHSSMAGKEETVYVLASATGAPGKVIVSDWLKNANGDASLSDHSNLKEIQNVKGEETFQTDADGKMIWNADGADIYYQGTTDQEVPVAVKLTYQLDGKDISPEDLAGKSGKVTIRMDYENSATRTVTVGGKEEEIKVPFAMLSGMVLPEEHFSNIEVTNGRVLSEGNNSVVVGVAFPGLKESIDADTIKDTLKKSELSKNQSEDLKIPDYLEVTADATDFALDMTMTVAMSDILSDINLTDSIDLSDLNDSMDQLKNATGELEDGTTQLKDGSGQLKDGADQLVDGTIKLADGALTLKNGTQELYEKSGELANGANDLNDGAAKLSDGAGQLYDGTAKLKDGAESLNNGASQLKDGSSKLTAGTQSLVSGAEQLNSGAQLVKGGVQQVQTQMTTLKTSTTSLKQAAETVNAYIQGQGQATFQDSYSQVLANAVSAIQAQQAVASQQLSESQMNLAASEDRVQIAMAELEGAATGTSMELETKTGEHEETVTKEVTVEVPVATGEDEEEEETTTEVTNSVEVPVTVIDTDTITVTTVDPGNMQDKVDELQNALLDQACAKAQVEALTVQLSDLENQMQTLSDLQGSLASLSENQQQLATVMGASQILTSGLQEMEKTLSAPETQAQLMALVQGAGQLADGTSSALLGAKELNAGATSLDQGLAQLKSGAGELSSGAGTLKDGALTLKDGTSTLKDGTSKLKDGTDLLVSGTNELNNGAGTLQDGTLSLKDGVLTLDEGMGTLDQGALDLVEGMFRFDEEGISKLTNAFGQDAQDVIDRLQAVMDAGKEYTTFTELPDGVDGSVKFIIKTDAVK